LLVCIDIASNMLGFYIPISHQCWDGAWETLKPRATLLYQEDEFPSCSMQMSVSIPSIPW
jgi:hypothetical protein